MSKEFRDVAEFNRQVINLAPVEYLSQERLEWFKTAINEELGEFEKANADYIAAQKVNADEETLLGCHVDMIDAIIDLIYFALGRLYEIGVSEDDFDCMWDAIQNANMNKKRGNKGRGSDDDAIKPEGWQGPEQILIKHIKLNKGGATKFIKERAIACENFKAKIAAENERRAQLDTREQTQTAKNLISKLNDMRVQNKPQSDENFINITKGRETTMENYYNNGCTIPSTHCKVPLGVEQDVQQLHLPGMKYDEGKPNLSLVFGGFPKALLDVGQVGTFGARKYTPDGWKKVDNLQQRYMAALLRHTFSILKHDFADRETGRHHLAHVAWNALAMLEDWLTGMDYDIYDRECLKISEKTLQEHFEKKGQKQWKNLTN